MPLYPDLSNIDVLSQAGVAACQYAINDPSTGLPMGATGSISTGSSRGFGRYVAVKELTDNAAEPRVVNVSGDNGNFRQQYVFNPAELGPLAMNFGALDQNAHTRWTNTKIETLGDFNIVGYDTNQPPNAKSATLLVTTDAQNGNSSYFGQPGFSNFVYMSVNVTPLARAMTEVTGMTWQYRGVPTQTSRKPWGPLFSTVTNGFTRAKCLEISSRNPLTMDTIVTNGTTTAYALSATPDSDGTGYTFYMFRYQSDGTVTAITPSSVIPGNKTVVLSSAYTSGDVILVLYSSFDVIASV